MTGKPSASADASNVAALANGRVFIMTALLCALSGLALQFLIVHIRYGGNWTALFCAGSHFPAPPALAGENIYVFRNSNGYDGQMYHYVAHDPLIRTDIWRYLDEPRLRYRRILLPGMAYLLAAGRQSAIDAAYIAANLLFLFLGAWWLSRYLDGIGLDARLAALFALTPAALISLDRLTIDLAFTTLCIGFALYLRLGRNAPAYAVLLLACLSRETGIVVAVAASLALSWQRRFARAALLCTAAAPAAAWYLYVNARAPGYGSVKLERLIPFRALFEAVLTSTAYPFGAALNAGLVWLDRLALVGMVLAMLLGVWLARRNGLGQMEAVMLMLTMVGLCLPRWDDIFSTARVFTPLLIYVILHGIRTIGWKAAVPLLMTTPRIALQVLVPLIVAVRST